MVKSIVDQMNDEFAKKEAYYVTELAKKTKLIGLYKDENKAKDLRINNLEKRVNKYKANPKKRGYVNAIKSDKSSQTEDHAGRDEYTIPLEISFENPIKRPENTEVKNSILVDLPRSQFEKVDLQSMPITQEYDKALEKSSARLEVISKQEEILLNLNKHLNSDSNIFPDQLISDLKIPGKSSLNVNQVSPSNLGVSLKKFSEKLMNVIEINNKVLKVVVTRVKH